HGRPHHRRPRRAQARPGVRHRGDGRAQARRVRADPHVPVPRRPGDERARAALTMAQSGTKIAATRVTRKGATIHKTNERPGTRAEVRYVRVSAYKAREGLDLIRGKHVNDADEILQLVERDVAIPIRKLLDSAIANASNNDSQAPEPLFVSACYADEGPTLKRWRPRSRGRASRIRKRPCHVTVLVSRLPENDRPRRRTRSQVAQAERRRRRAGQQAAAERAATAERR